MPRRIDLGRAVLIAGAALLFISLFLEWYDTGPTGWQVFETLDLLLAALALAGIAAALRPELTPPWAAWAIPAAALVIVVVQLLNAPPAAGDGSPSTGAWLAVGGSLLMAAGAALSLASISVTVQVRERDPRRRVPAVDRRGEATAAGPEADDEAGADAPDARGTRLGTRESPASRPAAVVAPEPEPDGLDRTQPLTGLDDPAAEERERS